jgi:phosphate transport system protein
MTELTLGEKLRALEVDVQALGNLVEGMLIDAADLLRSSDLDALEQLGDTERLVHRKRLAIEMDCLALIATSRPPDRDLRPLVAMTEIAAELERMADHARRMARANAPTADHRFRGPLTNLKRLAEEVQSLLDGALEAFAQRDAGRARRVASETSTVERLYREVRGELLAVIKSKPRVANHAIFVSRSVYHLWRAAERVVGICEWVVFAAEDSAVGREIAAELPVRLTEEASSAI